MKRFFLMTCALAVLFALPFFLWRGHWDWGIEGAVAWVRQAGTWGGVAAVVLLASDLFLPIPASGVMSALGFVYGPLVGGAIGAVGSICSGLLGYGVGRLFGDRAVRRLLGDRDAQRGRSLFHRYGGWLVAVSRWLPLLPEIVSSWAGLLRMPFVPFLVALACGSIPMAFTFAVLGHFGSAHPVLSLGLSAGVPPCLWWLIGRKLLRQEGSIPEATL